MFKYSLSKKEKKLALITLIVASAAIIYDFGLEPFFGRWQKLDKEVRSKTIILKQNQKLLRAYDGLEEEYKGYYKHIGASKPSEGYTQTLREVENLSKKTACRILNIKPFVSRDKGGYKEILFDITAEGVIDNFSGFLYELEKLKSPLRVESFTLVPKSHTQGELKGTLRVKRIVFLDASID